VVTRDVVGRKRAVVGNASNRHVPLTNTPHLPEVHYKASALVSNMISNRPRIGAATKKC
jgi:hypothetical protein